MTWLLIGLLAGHFIGDFTPLATTRMQHAKANGGPLGPILAHAGVHAALVTLVLIALAPAGAGAVAAAAAFEFGTHFLLDTTRARLGARVPALGDPAGRPFWTLLGLDQFGHAVVLVLIAGWVT